VVGDADGNPGFATGGHRRGMIDGAKVDADGGVEDLPAFEKQLLLGIKEGLADGCERLRDAPEALGHGVLAGKAELLDQRVGHVGAVRLDCRWHWARRARRQEVEHAADVGEGGTAGAAADRVGGVLKRAGTGAGGAAQDGLEKAVGNHRVAVPVEAAAFGSSPGREPPPCEERRQGHESKFIDSDR